MAKCMHTPPLRQVSFFMPNEEKERLEQYSRATATSQQTVVRNLIRGLPLVRLEIIAEDASSDQSIDSNHKNQ